MSSDKLIISMLVRNETGVLTRISGLFARRGFNISSLSVGETRDPEISRMTIMAVGDDYIHDQIVKQLEKLHDVLVIEKMEPAKTVVRELLLLKINAAPEKRSEVMEACSVFRAKIVDLTPDALTVEITGEESKCDAFIEYLKPYGIAEMSRTGLTAIARGGKTIRLPEKN